MLRTTTCSDSAKLDLFVRGVLPEAEATEIAEHTDQCPVCQAALETLDEDQNELVRQLRKGFNEAEDSQKRGPVIEDDVTMKNESLTTSHGLPRDEAVPVPKNLNRLLKRLEDLSDGPEVAKPSWDWLVWAGKLFGRAGDGQPMLGEFRLQRVLGAGGMGVVFEAFDASLQRLVAIKVLRPEFADDKRNRERFLTEAQAMATLSHPHIVRVFRTGTIAGLPFLTMELLEGETLAQRLVRGPALSLPQILKIARDVALGLAVAHHVRLVHRDVKPDNIILEGKTDHISVKLLDFGLARDVSKSDLDEDRGWVLGTPAFMSPEQAMGEVVTEQSDLFSLGCVLYRMLSGRLPFDEVTPQAMLRARKTQSPVSLKILLPTLSPEITALVDRLLAGDPHRRPASAEEVAHELQRLARPYRPKFTPRQAVLTVGLIACIAGVMFVGKFQWSTQPGQAATSNLPTITNRSAKESTDPVKVAAEFTPNVEVRKPAAPLDPEWFHHVSNLDSEKQVVEVVAEMKRRNPKWDGTHEFDQRAGVVTRFRFSPLKVYDLSPVRAFVELEFLQFPGGDRPGDVFELTPLTGLSLRILDCGMNPIADFSPLKGMPLNILRAKSTAVKDLQPLSELPLHILQLAETPVTDLSPIKNCPLRLLSFWNTKVNDLSPVKGMQTLNRLECERTGVSDLSPLKGMKLTYLACEKSPIRDYSILREFPLEELHLSYDPAVHRDLLRSISTLKRINYKPVDEVLK